MLVNESTNAMNLIALGNNANKSNTSLKSENQTSFADFLQPAKKDVSNSIGFAKSDASVKEKTVAEPSGTKDTVKESSEATSTVTDENETNNLKEAKPVSNDDVTKGEDASTKTEESVVTTENDAISDGNVVDVSLMVPDIDLKDENMEVLQEMLASLVQQITQILDISASELGEKLEDFSMDFSDLLSEDGVKDFFLAMNSADVSDLLVDEQLNEEWNQLLENFDDILESVQNESDESLLAMDTMFTEAYVSTSDVNVFESIPQDAMQKDASFKEMKHNSEEVVVNTEKTEEVTIEVEVTESLAKDTKSSSQGDTKTDTQNEDSAKKDILNSLGNAMDQFGNVSAEELDMGNITETSVSGREIINQVVEQIRVNMNQNNTSMEMQLYPEHLGKIQINVVSKDGVMTARIIAESETAKQAIESGLANLRESFEKQDLKVDAIEVMVSTTGFANSNEEQSSYDQQQNGANSRRKLDLSGLEDEEAVDEESEKVKMEYSGSSVSYTA